MGESQEPIAAITGGAGRVGRLVAADLLDRGFRVRILDLPQVSFEGLAGTAGVQILAGDIGDGAYLEAAFVGASAIAHLAAVLPPAADDRPDLARRVNVEGTRNVLSAMRRAAPRARLVFSSSVVVYGNTQGEQPPVAADRSLQGRGGYAESKIAAEALVWESGVRAVTLRISGVSVADFLMPPVPWPFTAEQRMEFVLLEDVASAVAAAVCAGERVNGTAFNISGGPTWRMRGRDYSDAYYGAFEIPPEEARFLKESRAFDFYETAPAAEELGFEPVPFAEFQTMLKEAIALALSG